MSQLVGANPDELDRLAARLDTASSSMRGIRSNISASVRRSPWHGWVADRFRSDWSSQHAVAMRSAEAFLDDAADRLRREATEQRAASRDVGAGSRPGVSTNEAGPACPVGLGGMEYATRIQMEQRLAELTGPEHRAERERLEKLLAGDRQFLMFSDTPGDERIIEVHGDLSRAKKVIIHIPGISTNLDSYVNGGHSDAQALFGGATDMYGPDVAVVSFANYPIPGGLDGLNAESVRALLDADSDHGARIGGENLRQLVAELHRAGFRSDDISVVAHSYGTSVTGAAMKDGLDVSRVIALGSPGMGGDSRAAIGSPNVDLYAGSSGDDFVDDGSGWFDGLRLGSKVAMLNPVTAGPGILAWGLEQKVSGSHGESPAGMDGVHPLDTAGARQHSDYFKDEQSLKNVLSAALGVCLPSER